MLNRPSKIRRCSAAWALGLSIALACAAPVFGPHSAYADGSSGEESADDPCLREPKCQELIGRAREASQGQRYEEALRAYIGAYAVKPVPWLLLNIGRVQHKLGHYQDAMQMYRAFLELPRQEGDEEQRAKAEDYLRKAETEQKSVRVQEPKVVVVRESRPAYKHWWFWTLLGGAAAAVVVTGVVTAVATRPPPPELPQAATIYYRTF